MPSSFKNELSKILSENTSLKDNPTLPLLQINKSKEEVNDSEEKMLDYLRYQEAELLLAMNRMNSNSQQYHQSVNKFNEIQNMKAVVEQSVLQKKVRQATEQANENMSKRQATFLKNQSNALSQM